MGFRDKIGRAFGKVKEEVSGKVVPNIKQAKAILQKLETAGNIENGNNIASGGAATLILNPSDFVAYANKVKDNALDRVLKIANLLATSILTSTTTHKKNDFKDVEALSKKCAEAFRNNLLTELNKTDKSKSKNGTGAGDGQENSGSVFEEACELLEEGKGEDSIWTLSRLVYPEPENLDFYSKEADVIMKDINKNRAAVVKQLLKYCKQMDAKFKNISTMLKKKPLCGKINEEIGKCNSAESLALAEKEIRHLGIDWNRQIKLDKDAILMQVAMGLKAGLCYSGALVLLCAAPGAGVGLVGLASVYALLGSFILLTGMLLSPSFRMKFVVKNYKDAYNKLIGEITAAYAIAGDAKRYIISEMKKGKEKAGIKADSKDSEDKEGEEPLNKGSVDAIKEFIREFKEIWSNYASEGNRLYGYFEDQKEIAVLSNERQELQDKRDFCDKIIAELKKCKPSLLYVQMDSKMKKDLQKLSGIINKFYHKYYGMAGDTYFAQYMHTKHADVSLLLHQLENDRWKINYRMQEINDKITDLSLPSWGLSGGKGGRGKEKTSEMGKFKDGFAKTLAEGTSFIREMQSVV